MSAVAEEFTKAFGPPDPPDSPGLSFRTPSWRRRWDRLHADIGAGWFRHGFLYLFGKEIDRLAPCLDAWSFLLPRSESRMILGRNAYGAILVLENTEDVETQSVHVLDPFTVTYGKVPNAHFLSLVGRVLPRRELPLFVDDAAYKAWLDHIGLERIATNEILGVILPRALGGKLVSENLRREDIVEYYESTGPTYAAALATLPPSARDI